MKIKKKMLFFFVFLFFGGGGFRLRGLRVDVSGEVSEKWGGVGWWGWVGLGGQGGCERRMTRIEVFFVKIQKKIGGGGRVGGSGWGGGGGQGRYERSSEVL